MGKKVVLLVLAVVVLLIIGGYAFYTWRQAENMRTKFYRPLYQEVSQVQEVVIASSISRAVPSTTFIALQKDPLWNKVPETLRESLKDTYDKVFDCQSEMVVAHAHWMAMANLAARGIRKQADDQAWLDKVNQSSPAAAAARPGQRKFLRHEAHIDRSDPAHPRRIPGGPYWHMTDWLEYPQNVADLEREWGENEFLFLTDSI